MLERSHHQETWLLVGATGSVGRRLLARLQHQDGETFALSRQPKPVSMPQVQWLRCDLYQSTVADVPAATRVLSAGPLDGLAAWSAHARWPEGARLIALSSLSAETKQASALPDERALAQRLCAAEETLRTRAADRGWSLTLLRVSLIYDPLHKGLSLDRLVEWGRRLHFLPLPSDAQGLRQPVHADDLARAMLALAASNPPHSDTLRLPGGETLSFAQMVSRYLQNQIPTLPVLQLPVAFSRCAETLLQWGSSRHRQLAAQLRRSRRDLVVESADWQVVGLQPRAFLDLETGPESLY